MKIFRERKRSCKGRYLYEYPRLFAVEGIRPLDPDQPKVEEKGYSSEKDFIEKRTKLIRQSRRPVFVTGIDGRKHRLHVPVKTVTSASWKIYQEKQKLYEDFHLVYDKACIDSPVSSSGSLTLSDSESLPLVEEKPELEAVTSAPLDVPDNTNTVTELDVPENTPTPGGDLVAESLLGDKHDGEDESLGTTTKKKAHQKMHDKKKRKSIVLSPGRISMRKLKMQLKTLKKSYDQLQTSNSITSN
ncbi:uncharacterized protein LOC141658699 [Silene latifolia]|uniref:uncharacterized protein LOC141658699 n=1 Tax=Silene latifolia TaxID=37657 RepID=UPI003D780A9F